LPTIGVPLPLMSYGGSALLAVMSGVALIANVRGRRFVN
jgi:cell division protein FtsW (lipid II flippase)